MLRQAGVQKPAPLPAVKSDHSQLALDHFSLSRLPKNGRQEGVLGVNNSSFDPGVLVVKSCPDSRDCWPQLTVTIRAPSQPLSGALKS